MITIMWQFSWFLCISMRIPIQILFQRAAFLQDSFQLVIILECRIFTPKCGTFTNAWPVRVQTALLVALLKLVRVENMGFSASNPLDRQETAAISARTVSLLIASQTHPPSYRTTPMWDWVTNSLLQYIKQTPIFNGCRI